LIEAVAVRLDNHPPPSDTAEQKKLDRISQYISQFRIAGDLAEEALRHVDAEQLAEAKERAKKAESFFY
jgi:transcription elongation GreA/GreB family factor